MSVPQVVEPEALIAVGMTPEAVALACALSDIVNQFGLPARQLFEAFGIMLGGGIVLQAPAMNAAQLGDRLGEACLTIAAVASKAMPTFQSAAMGEVAGHG